MKNSNIEYKIWTVTRKDTASLQKHEIKSFFLYDKNLNFEDQDLAEYEEIVILSDLKDKGYDKFHKKHDGFPVPVIGLPNYSTVEDFFNSGKSKSELFRIIENETTKYYRSLTNYPAGLLSKMKFSNKDFIVSGILPTRALCGLVGSSESGKSLFALQFAFSYMMETKFISYPVRGGKKVIYFALEDSQHSLDSRFKKLSLTLNVSQKRKIDRNLIFSHVGENISNTLREHLLEHPKTGLVFIDTHSNLMSGKDLNSSGDTRSMLGPLYDICINHELTIILIHHLNKNSAKGSGFNKNSINGSQSFEAQMRIIIELNKKVLEGGETKYNVAITKGNNVSENVKGKNSTLSLSLCEHNLWFSTSIPDKDKNSATKNSSNTQFEIDWSIIFGPNEELKSIDIKNRLMNKYTITNKTAENWISKYLKDCKIKRGLYRKPTLDKIN